MSKKNTKRHTPEFKARVALEAAQEQESLARIGQRYGVHPVLVGQWKNKKKAAITSSHATFIQLMKVLNAAKSRIRITIKNEVGTAAAKLTQPPMTLFQGLLSEIMKGIGNGLNTAARGD